MRPPFLLGQTSYSIGQLLSLKGIAADLEFVVRHAAGLGLGVRPGSRLFHFRRMITGLLSKADHGNRIEVDNMEMFKQGIIDISQLYCISSRAGGLMKSAEYQTLLKEALTGDWRAYAHKPETPGRDAQFHLLCATALQAAGFEVQVQARHDPDILTVIRGMKIGIAVKRIKSYKQIAKHLRKACRQSSLGVEVGVAFLDISMPANPHNRYLPVESQQQAAMATELLVNEDIATFRRDLASCSSGTLASAAVFYAQVPYATSSGERGLWAHWLREDLVEAQHVSRIVGLEITRRLGALKRAVPQPERSAAECSAPGDSRLFIRSE